MKNRIVLSGFILALAIAMIAGATLAWFTDSDTAGEAVFTAGTVSIEAGRKVGLGDGSSCTKEVDIFPARVVEWEQGDAGVDEVYPVNPLRSVPETVLTLTVNPKDGEPYFFSLGFGGYIIVEFDYPVYATELLVVCEETWGSKYPPETADIFVSTARDGPWIYVGTADNDDSKGNNQKYNRFEDVGNKIKYVKYVKVVDTSKPEDFADINDQKTVDGFDLNSIRLSGIICEEDNWNPGDCNIRKYVIENTGTKGIFLRGRLTGEWYAYNEAKNDWEPWTPDPPDDDVVTIVPASDEENWEIWDDGYFYYSVNNVLTRIPGTYEKEDESERTVELTIKVCLKGEETTNQYQGKRYIVSAVFEAVQSSHDAYIHEWFGGHVP